MMAAPSPKFVKSPIPKPDFNDELIDKWTSPVSPEPPRAPAKSSPSSRTKPSESALRSPGSFERNFSDIVQIGGGSYGVVYKARSHIDNQVYAIKKVLKRSYNDEVKSMIRVAQSSHCVRYYRSWIENDIMFIQTEFCEGGSLDKYNELMHARYQTRSLPESDLWGFLADILLGLRDIHAAGLVHLDIKPHNLYLTASKSLKIGDFGIATKAGGPLQEDGDARYLAPEILNNFVTPAADVFSAAMTILDLGSFKMLPSDRDAIFKNGRIEPRLFGDLSRELASLLQDMLQPDPTKRITVDQLLQHPHIKSLLWRRKVKHFFRGPLALLSLVISGFMFVFMWLTSLLPRRSRPSPAPQHASSSSTPHLASSLLSDDGTDDEDLDDCEGGLSSSSPRLLRGGTPFTADRSFPSSKKKRVVSVAKARGVEDLRELRQQGVSPKNLIGSFSLSDA